MRIRPGLPLYVGAFFAVATLFFVYLAIRNFTAYFTMRSTEVRVLASSMKIDIMPAPDSDSSPYLGYLLRLNLQTTDDTPRNLSWETEAGKAVYPEEALDELQAWAPGTVHKIQFLRGDARSLRIEELERSPELESAIGCLIVIALFSMIMIFCLVAARADEPKLAKAFFGPWLIFVGFGMMPLLGWIGFTTSHVWKAITWLPVSVDIPEQSTKLDPATLPPNVEITQAAKEKLESNEYRVFTFPWNGKLLSGAVGSLQGEFDDHENAFRRKPGPLSFRISPVNRWALQVNFGKGEAFWVPFGILLLFGIAFTGAGLFVRKMSNGR
jgi:hypothetical protein